MPVLNLDSVTRLKIARAIVETTGKRQAFRFIALPDDAGLLMLTSRCPGKIEFDLLTRQKDLFGDRLVIDVSGLVHANLENNRDWVQPLYAEIGPKGATS